MEPIYCGPQQREPSGAPLIANLRGHFAEFLNHRSPERLSLLDPPTCVSFSTVSLLQSLEAFLGDPSNTIPVKPVGRSPCIMSTHLHCSNSVTSTDISNRPRAFWWPSLHRSTDWGGNINPLSIVYAFRPRLRYRLTLGGFAFPRKPYALGEQDSHLFYRYSFRHNHLYRPRPLVTVGLVSPIQRFATA